MPKQRGVVFELEQRPDGWIEVVKGEYTIHILPLGAHRLLYRHTPESPPVEVCEKRHYEFYAIPDPLTVRVGEQYKIEAIEI